MVNQPIIPLTHPSVLNFFKLFSVLLCLTGSPAPTLSVTANDDFQSFFVRITTPGQSSVCVLGYVLNITEDGGTRATMPVDTSGVALVGDLNLCNNSYSFTASATTRNGTSDLSDPVTGEVDFSGGKQFTLQNI